MQQEEESARENHEVKEKSAPKAPYSKPVLKTYGNIKEAQGVSEGAPDAEGSAEAQTTGFQ